jgi:hypothetical protein
MSTSPENRMEFIPSGRMEAVLLREFRRHHRVRAFKRAMLPVAVAAAVAAGVFSMHRRPVHTEVPVASAKPVPAKPEPMIAIPKVAEVKQERPKPVTTARRRKPAKRVVVPTAEPEVLASQPVREEPFVAFPYTPQLTEVDRGQVLRVSMPASALRSYGVMLPPQRAMERIKADVLVGEDGLARAIRFVK